MSHPYIEARLIQRSTDEFRYRLLPKLMGGEFEGKTFLTIQFMVITTIFIVLNANIKSNRHKEYS